MDYSMVHVIERIKAYCREGKYSEYNQVVAVARGILDAIKRFESDRTYAVADVCSLLEALHDIIHTDVEQKCPEA